MNKVEMMEKLREAMVLLNDVADGINSKEVGFGGINKEYDEMIEMLDKAKANARKVRINLRQNFDDELNKIN